MKHIFSSNIEKTRTSTTAESSTYPKTELAWICLYFLQFRNAKVSNYALSFAIMRCCLGGSTSISIKFRKALDHIILVLIIYPCSYFTMPLFLPNKATVFCQKYLNALLYEIKYFPMKRWILISVRAWKNLP